MRRFAQAALLVLSGLGLLHAALFTDLYLNLVKPGMRPLLIASGAVLLALGAWAAAEAWGRRRTGGGPDDHGHGHGHGNRRRPEGGGSGGGDAHGHDHSRVPRVAWLLFLPVLSLLFYAPPALGSYTASREPAKAVAVEEDGFDPLPATSPLPITLTDFTQRVQQDRSRAVGKRTVVMTGFVTPAPGGDGWYLTRIIVSCCAADASSVKVLVHGAAAPKADTWVNVTGTWHPGGTLGTASAAVALDARSVAKAPKPSNAYVDALPLTS
ncbi:TIGR03943 family putative permease subunit [Streptomyces sp. B21-101]|uniref:TIGR03943 family putative permease subunit n=1 Tax=Streptomyces sp. B21-101 TaxID=3039415 RepID=UPI002FF405C1